MPGNVIRGIRRGLKEALAFAKNEARAGDYRVHMPAHIDGQAIRQKQASTPTQLVGMQRKSR
jgi:hypothetical protein